MRSFFVLVIAIAFIPGIVFAQSVAAQAGVTPESPLYFFDRIGESIAELFAFTPARRAQLELSFAAERIAEIELMLAEKGVSARGITVAEVAFAEHLAKTAAIAEREKRGNNDALAEEITQGVHHEHDALADVFREHKQELDQKEKELYDAADATGDEGKRAQLRAEIEQVTAEKTMTVEKIGEQEEANDGEEHATSTDALFGKSNDIKESDRERLERSIQSVEDEIKRTEEFLKEQKENRR